MDRSNSATGEEDVLSRCRERKRFMKLAIENRYKLATAHVAYMDSLRRMGTGLRLFAEGETMSESSYSTSPIGTSELAVVLPEKSVSPSPFPSSSPSLSQPQSPRSERAESRSPLDSFSSHGSGSPAFNASPLRMNYMRSGVMEPKTFKEQPPSPESGRVQSYSTTPRYGGDPESPFPVSPSSSQKSIPPPPASSSSAPGTLSWEFFNIFSPLAPLYHFSADTGMSQPSEGDSIDLKHARDEEGIPDLEDGDQEEEYIHDETKEANHLEESTSKASFIDSDKRHSETAAMDTGFSVDKHVPVSRADGITKGCTDPSVEAVVQPIREDVVEGINSRYTEEGNEEAAKNAAEKVDALMKDKRLANKETLLEKENPTEFVGLRGRNFLSSLKNIEDQFIKACDSGKEVSKMLEANKVHYYPGFTEKKGKSWKCRFVVPCGLSCCMQPTVLESHEPPSKALTVTTWHQSTPSHSSSSKTPFASSSKDDIDDSSSDFVEDTCMISGSHSSTLDRLYAWEIKLYEEVKAGDAIRRVYEKKCVQLRHQESKGASSEVIDKIRATIKDLYSRVRVAIEAVDSVSKRIQKLRDEELQPQLMELIQGLMKMWDKMGQCHEFQYQIIKDANISGRLADSVIFNDSYRQATIHLEKELQNWQSRFMDWMGAQKAYVLALHGWLLKCIKLPEQSTRGRQVQFSPHKAGAPLVVIICSDWSREFENLKREVDVVEAIKTLVGNLQAISAHWDENQNGKDLDRKVSIRRVGSRILDTQGPPLDNKKSNSSRAGNSIADDKNLSDSLRKQAEAGYHKVMQQTHVDYLKKLQKGLEKIFERLFDLAYKSHKICKDLHENSGRAHFPSENGRRSYS